MDADEHYIPEFAVTLDEETGVWVATARWRGGPVLRDTDFERLKGIRCVAARCRRAFEPACAP